MLKYSSILLMFLSITPVFALTAAEEEAAKKKIGEPTVFEFKEESPKQTPAQRCSINACNKQCDKVWTHKLNKNGDDGAIEVKVCQELCAKQKPFCLAHEGSSIEFPKIPKSDMHDLELVYCARVNDEFCVGFK